MVKSKKNASNEEPLWVEGTDNVFKDLGFADEEAVNLLARADLMIQLRELIKQNGWSQRQAARELGVGQPRIAEIMSLRTECFSIDLLLKYFDKLGHSVKFVVERKGEVA